MGFTPGQWQRVKELYEAAQTWSGEERTNRVDSEPDALVRAEVLRLLSEQQELGSFLSTPAFARNTPDGPQERIMSPGQMLAGRFRILEFLAAGGMGEVYKAEDVRLDRLVALKFLPRELAEDCESLERLHREAKAASGLNHPNICTVYDFGQDGERAFIAMEYLEGETLSARLKRGPLPLDDTLNVSIALANALGSAHRNGIVHRDLKPGNIMLNRTGLKLLDFGLAKYEKPAAQTDETVTELTGVGRIAGTLPYMSPEQLLGNEVDARGDIFAFGAVLYEMLTGKRAFEHRSKSDTVTGVDREEPKPISEFVKNVPPELQRIVQKCLRKQAEERYASVAAIETELQQCRALVSEPTSGINLKLLVRKTKKPRVAVPLALTMVLVVGLAVWAIHRSVKVKWAREEALPQISKLIGDNKIGDAYTLAVQAERYIPKDPILAKLWPQISWSEPIHTIPPGAAVYRRPYNAPNGPWEFVGRSPIEKRRFSAVDSQWKFELKGFATVERATFPDESLTETMDEESKFPAGMVHVEISAPSPSQVPLDQRPNPVILLGLPGFENLPAIPLGDFWIDRYEVTNKQFKKFLDQGGYRKQDYWKHDFFKDGHKLSWAEAMKLFLDRTGRPGPTTWVQGEYPRGQEDYPVTGVSWFEAAAYAEFAGKSLPTIYHWTAAASPQDGASMIPESNFGGSGPALVGSYHGMSWCGAYDMAGNVKEWVSNEASSGNRYIMGGAWNEPTYFFNDPDARSPFQRSDNFGFRCAKYSLSGGETKAANPVTVQARDFSREGPVSDQIFRAYKSLYSYDKTPLRAVLESTDQTDDWKREKITFNASYGNERIIAYLFLPKNTHPPFQTVVYFPGAGAHHLRSSADSLSRYRKDYDSIVKSGRALMFPVYKGTFERGGGPEAIYWPNTTSSYRDYVIAWSKDLGRSIDYLETRPDIDHNKLAYEGYSWGAALGAVLPAVENRLKALVLIAGGFYLQARLPEVDQLNFAPRVKAPALMLNGRFDFIFPVVPSQEPMFRLLGAPQTDKRHVVYGTGHDIPEAEMIKETLSWLDRYLGPVQ